MINRLEKTVPSLQLDMEGPVQERDWKYLRSIQNEMIDELCSKVLERAANISAVENDRPHQRYLRLFRYLKQSDEIIAECFNDWSRSTIGERIISLRRHKLLADEHVKHLSETARKWLKMVEEFC